MDRGNTQLEKTSKSSEIVSLSEKIDFFASAGFFDDLGRSSLNYGLILKRKLLKLSSSKEVQVAGSSKGG